MIEGTYNFTASKAFNSSSKQREGGEHLCVSHSDRKSVKVGGPSGRMMKPFNSSRTLS